MILKRWAFYKGSLEITFNLKNWMVGVGFDYGMVYIDIGPFEMCYCPEDSIDWRG